MKFLFDANIPKKAQKLIRGAFSKHEFISAWQDPFDPNMPDVELFKLAKTEGVDTVITHDIVQMIGNDRRNERQQCANCGLHWLGIPQPYKTKGPEHKAAHTASGLIHALTFAIDIFTTANQPTAILLRNVPDTLTPQKGFPQAI